jgi:hypothetical protein
MLRGQTSAEFLLISAVGVTLLIFTLYSMRSSLGSMGPSISTARFADSLQSIYSNADMLNEGSQRIVSVDIPEDLTAYHQNQLADGSYLSSFTFRGLEFRRLTPYRLLIFPSNFTLSKGRHVARMYCRKAGEVIVEFIY